MVNQIEDADFVLVVCTKTYARRFSRQEQPGRGLGGSWEGAIITLQLYESQSNNTRFLPVIFSPRDAGHIPTVLRSATHYQVDTERGYESLYRRVTQQPAVLKPELGERRILPPVQGGQDSSTIWNLPYRRNPFFTGREVTLERLRIALTVNEENFAQPLAVSGLGGIGKTQVTAEYAYRYHNEYKAVFWTPADSRESLISGFVSIATLLHLRNERTKEQSEEPAQGEEDVKAVKRWFEINSDWLLILDNADDLAIVADFIPARGNGHILLTTQAQATGGLAQRVELEYMGLKEGALLLLRRAKIIESEQALEAATKDERLKTERIVEEVGGLPLALDQAGAFMEETPSTPGQYLNLYREAGARLRAQRGELPSEHPESVTITFSLSFERVDSANPAAADLLRLCAFLDPQAVPEEILITGAPHLGRELEPVAGDPIKLAQTIRDAGRFSLLRREPGTNTLGIHRLVQEVLKDAMDDSTRYIWAGRAVLAVNSAFDNSGHLDSPRFERLIPHARTCAKLIEEWEFDFAERAHLLENAGTYLYRRVRYEEAEPFFEQLLAVRENDLGPHHPGVATATRSLANLYRGQGRWEESDKLFRRTNEILSKELTAGPHRVGGNLSDWAHLYLDIGRLDLAEEKLRQALGIYEKTLETNDPEFALVLDNLAIVYNAQGEPERAIPYHLRGLSIRERTLAPDDPGVAESLHNTAKTYYDHGDYAVAENYFQRALDIFKEKRGLDHPSTIRGIEGLGLVYLAQGEPSKAESHYLRELKAYENALGPNHLYVAEVLDLYSAFLTQMNRYGEAQKIAARAEQIRDEST